MEKVNKPPVSTLPHSKQPPKKPMINLPKKANKKSIDTKVSINNQKVLRSPDGRFMKGHIKLGGRKKGTTFKDRLNELVGNDSADLAIKLMEIAFYDQKKCKDKVPRYRAGDQIKALEMILKYKEQVPVTKTETTIKAAENTKWKLEVTHVDKNNKKIKINNKDS